MYFYLYFQYSTKASIQAFTNNKGKYLFNQANVIN